MFKQDYAPITWDEALIADLRQLLTLAIQEDLNGAKDWTTAAVVAADAKGSALVVSRKQGVAAGVLLPEIVIDAMQADITWEPRCEDGDAISPGTVIGRLAGNVQDMLTSERIILNFLGRLCGIATLTSTYVAELEGTKAKVYDTRKTTPGWRRLEKFAVRAGGGHNHRIGLYDAVLIKDNHLAYLPAVEHTEQPPVAVAMQRAKDLTPEFQQVMGRREMLIELEVDSLEQLANVLPLGPDIVLLDNMSPETLVEAVKLRDELAPAVELEASGNVNLQTIRSVALTGVERISCGSLTHGVTSLDIGLDWEGN